jgi:hypothetical protein
MPCGFLRTCTFHEFKAEVKSSDGSQPGDSTSCMDWPYSRAIQPLEEKTRVQSEKPPRKALTYVSYARFVAARSARDPCTRVRPMSFIRGNQNN